MAPNGCSMRIRFIWKPDYHAIQYLGATAVITVSGTDIAGSYRKKFTRKGLTLDVGPVSLLGGYKLWSARVDGAWTAIRPETTRLSRPRRLTGTKCD